MNKEKQLQLAYKLLWSTIEEYVGLWELFWEANSIIPSDKLNNKEFVKKIIYFFLEKGLVNLYYNKWGKDELQKIEDEEAKILIKGERFWLPPEINDICVKVGSTEKGDNRRGARSYPCR